MKTKAYTILQFIIIVAALMGVTATTAVADLKIDSVYPTLGDLDVPLAITVTGSEFDAGTRLSMALDSGNRRSVIGSVDTPSFANDIVISGNYAYVTDKDGGLQVVDISDPENPQIKAFEDTPGSAHSVALSGTHAFIADGESGLQVVDITNPQNPQLIGSGENTPGEALSIEIVGTRAYVADGDSGLQVIDISNPLNPQIIGTKSIGFYANSVTVSGNYAYLTGLPSGKAKDGALIIVDISNPSAMDNIGSDLMPTYFVYSVTVAGNYAYVATRHLGIQIVDISDPFNPQINQAVDTDGRSYSLTISGDTGYVADDTAGISVLDMTDLGSIQIVGTIDTPADARSISLKDEYAFVADGDGGLQVVDINSPNAQQVISWIPTPGVSQYFDVQDNKIYIGDAGGGMHVIDISDINSPAIIGTVPTNHRARHVDVVGNIAYVADTRGGLQVVDVSDPTSPSIMGSYNQDPDPDELDHWSRFVTVDGGNAYIANGSSGNQGQDVLILDISNPAFPSYVASVEMPSNADGRIAVKNGYAYAPDKSNGSVVVIDVRVPASASVVKTIDMPGSSDVGAKWITIDGNFAWVANGDDGICVLDISDPHDPSIAGSLDLEDRAHSLIIDGDTAYVANGDLGVTVVDISNLADMKVTGTVDTTGGAVCLYVKDDVVFVSDFGNGCIVVPLPVEVKPVSFTPPNMLTCSLPSPSLAGHYILRVFNNSGDFFDLDGAVTFSEIVRNSKAIIVQGGNYNPPDDDEEPVFEMVARDAYRALLFQGFQKDDIYFLGPDTQKDHDGLDGNDDVDDLNTFQNIEYGFTTWAPNQTPYDIIIYMVGHGNKSYYRPNNNDKILVKTAKMWMSNLETAVSGNIIFILDACQSGSFLLNMDPSAQQNRVVITSSKYNEASKFKNGGFSSYSHGFWYSVHSQLGARLDQAFNAGRDVVKSNPQTPQVDANGDLRPNTSQDDISDILIVGRGYQPNTEIPIIGTVSGSVSLSGGTSAEIWASGILTAGSGIKKVYAKITPPCDKPNPGTTVTDEDDVEVLLTDGNNDGIYEGTYSGFIKNGTYSISIYVENNDNILSKPKTMYVFKSVGADLYESDDTYMQASPIIIEDPKSQCHNFFDPYDEDWIKFYALSGLEYTIEASELGLQTDVVLEIYDTDGTTMLVQENSPVSPRSDEVYYWTCPSDGWYYVRLRPFDPSVSGEGTDYKFEIYIVEADISGTLGGTVMDADTKVPIEDAVVKVIGKGSGTTNDSGFYAFVLSANNPFNLTAEAEGYQQKIIPDIMVEEGLTEVQDIELELVDPDLPIAKIDSPSSTITIEEGGSVDFQASVTNGDEPFTYLWDFGGGATNQTVEDPGLVVFSSSGTFTVTFTVEDKDGQSDIATVTVTVTEPPGDDDDDDDGGGGGGGCFIGSFTH